MDVDPFAVSSRRPKLPRFRLRRWAIFWRVALLALAVLELYLWLQLRAVIPFQPHGRIQRLFFMLVYGPQLATIAVAIALGVTVVSEVVFRLVVRPGMVRWYNPRNRDPASQAPLPFILKSGEQVLREMPARVVDGPRYRPAGTLIRTTHALYFYPYAWDREPWMIPEGHIDQVCLKTPVRRVLYWVEGYPDNLVIRDDSGEETWFVVPDPREALSWFATSGTPHFSRSA